MSFTIPSVVIENGSANTRAGFSNDELPSVVFTSSYAKHRDTGKVFVGDDIYIHNRQSQFRDLDVYSLLSDGAIYNWDNVEQNWGYAFNKLKVYDNGNQDVPYPLVTTEPVWNSKKNKKKAAELAFEKFQVPSFAIHKNPLCVTYGIGKSNGLVIDVGAAVTSVSGVLDGNVLTKSSIHSKYAGDYLNYQIYNHLSKNYYGNGSGEPLSRNLYNLSKKNVSVSQSFQQFDLNNFLLNDIKYSTLATAQFPITSQNISNFGLEPKNYKLPDGKNVTINSEQLLITETLFKPLVSKSENKPNGEKNASGSNNIAPTGIIDMVLHSLNKFRDTPDIISQLLSNIIITGGTALISDLDKRIYFDLSNLLPNFQINCFCHQNLQERQNATWIGASILSSLNNFDGYVSKRDYEEFGEDLVYERFK